MGTPETSPAPRIPLKLDVEYRRSYARNGEIGHLKNISLSGAFLEHSNGSLKTNDKVLITFTVSGRVRKIHASVVWSNKYGSGLRFSPTNNRDVQIVDDLMYFVESKRENRRDVLDDIFKQVG
ncbi:MAG: PilZ domain-containing protein [Bdellovibrionaceae bacterium]|nr:PilZ domain-containing protein [Pseudobdellovibrionaceae bacterium]